MVFHFLAISLSTPMLFLLFQCFSFASVHTIPCLSLGISLPQGTIQG